ncbi:hypothetical protein STCU_10066 [Strigomonas culicis]|uniref:Uncharacterized protein n=1 Tax=Strigomonas culicis TaxID=28005 RepID=S9TNK5_9TRYP|nr:hypothetical protein STCU_10066 [Strigomonas culicis]|eukprot:EPY18304.1 hypothetical protein STCU_10066 [Strigomonas culicis]
MLVTSDKRVILDAERYEVRQWSGYAVFQFFSLSAYTFCFLGIQHECTVVQLEQELKRDGKAPLTDAELREGLSAERIKSLKSYRYLFGDIGRRYPLLRRIVSFLAYVTSALMFASAIVMLRRPIEGYLGVTSTVLVSASFWCFMCEVI